MNSQAIDNKIELIQWLSTLEDSIIIEKLMKFKKEETTEWWHKISGEERESIESGIRDADNGNLTPHSIARKVYEKWL